MPTPPLGACNICHKDPDDRHGHAFAIHVWRFCDAPDEYQRLSNNGGDEDWAVFVPAALINCGMWYPPDWLDRIDTCQNPQKVEVEGGTVYIGSHA